MKRLIAVLAGLLIMPAFAEVVPDWYYEDIEYSDEFADGDVLLDEGMVEDEIQQPAAPVTAPVAPVTAPARNAVTSRNAISRAVPASVSTTNTAARGTAQRPVSSRTTATANASRGTNAQNNTTTSRAATGTSGTTRAASAQQNVTSRRTTAATTPNTARAGALIQTDTVNTPLYTGRVGIRTTTASVRAPTARIATQTSASTQEVTSGPSLDELAQLTDFCKAQYTQCMDNFCNVLDDNQGRCSCSANLKNYAKTEDALKTATEDLQDVAQKIQYIGLTKDEIETLFSQTEAELAMQGRTDTTQLANDLNKIKNMIIDVRSGSAVATDTGMSMDLSGLLDFSFSSSGFDLNSLFNNNGTANSISNQRGADLYKTATARCKASVLNSCSAQGVDTAIITNAYDLEIDKQCIAYERSLTDANTQMTQTVRNAKSVLQKARLVVAQQKNAYDLRGCINALDSCMQDEFVCGTDYEGCLDPTGKYIVNGEIVIGSEPGTPGGTQASDKFTGMYAAWNYGSTNAWSTTGGENGGSLNGFIEAKMSSGKVTVPATDMVSFLQQKIGYVDTDGKSAGMCISVLNKCQNYTYTASNGSYNGKNDVIRGFLERTLIQVKTQQDEVLSSYAEGCLSDVAACLSTNGYKVGDDVAIKVAKQACNSMTKTCASAIGQSVDEIIQSAVSTK